MMSPFSSRSAACLHTPFRRCFPLHVGTDDCEKQLPSLSTVSLTLDGAVEVVTGEGRSSTVVLLLTLTAVVREYAGIGYS